MKIVKMTPEEVQARQLNFIRSPDISPAESLESAFVGYPFNAGVWDWRSYVPDEVIHQWTNLTDAERNIVVCMAQYARHTQESEHYD